MSDRMLRVNSILREVLADEIERMSDTRLEMVSVVSVDTAPNLRTAVVYIDVLGRESEEDALAALRGASRRLQSTIGAEVRMKYTPTLEFQIDPGITGGEHIDQLLRELHADEDPSSEAAAGEDVVGFESSGSEAAAGGSEQSERRGVVPPQSQEEE